MCFCFILGHLFLIIVCSFFSPRSRRKCEEIPVFGNHTCATDAGKTNLFEKSWYSPLIVVKVSNNQLS